MTVVRRLLLLVTACLSLAYAGQAAATEVVVPDDLGRSIRFDIRAEGVGVEWYAALLRAAPHADEISTVRIDLVTPTELVETCGQEAAGCYGRKVITVAATETAANAHTLVHEYGHHVDASRGVAEAREPNGSSTWWRARGMTRLVATRSAFHGYVRGWDRNIAEIFAEDYAQVARPGDRPRRRERPRLAPHEPGPAARAEPRPGAGLEARERGVAGEAEAGGGASRHRA